MEIIHHIFALISKIDSQQQRIGNGSDKKVFDQRKAYVITSVVIADRQIFSSLTGFVSS